MSDTKDYTKNLKLRGPSIRATTTVINRGSSGAPGLISQRSSTMRQSITPMYSYGTLSGMSHKGVTEVITGRETEKKQMQGLNERFASYIEKVRFLEAQNKCCVNEIERLKKAKGFDVSEIKELYEQEVKECRKIIEDLSSQKSKFDAVLVGLQDALDDERRERVCAENEAKDLRGKLDAITNQIGEYEGEIATLRARIDNLEDELAHVKGAHKRVSDDLTRARAELDVETQKRIDAERDCQMIEDELRFQLNICEAEIKELKSLVDKDRSVDIRNFWKGEIQKTINDLQKEYDSRFGEMKHNYELTMENKRRDLEAGIQRDNMERDQLREECKRLKCKIGDTNPRLSELESLVDNLRKQLEHLRDEYDDYRRTTDNELEKKDLDLQKVLEENDCILKELQNLEDAKLSMELEIGTYRKLLDGEEQSLNTTIQSISGARSKEADNLADMIQQSSMGGYQSSYGGGYEQLSGGGGGGMSMFQSSSSGGGGQDYENAEDLQETSGRATVQKSHRGPIAFQEAHSKGLYVQLENVDRSKTFDLNGYCVVKIVGKDEKCRYTFKQSCVLKAGEVLILHTRKATDADLPSADRVKRILCDFNTWFQGGGKFVLKDENSVDKATMEIKYT